MRHRPLTTVPRTAAELGVTQPTAAAALRQLEQLGIMHGVTGRQRDRLFAYREYVDILNEAPRLED